MGADESRQRGCDLMHECHVVAEARLCADLDKAKYQSCMR